MATLMEKDAAIEMLSSTIAQINRYQDTHGKTSENHQDWGKVCDKQDYVYSTKPEDLDYPDIVAFKTALKAKYPA